MGVWLGMGAWGHRKNLPAVSLHLGSTEGCGDVASVWGQLLSAANTEETK